MKLLILLLTLSFSAFGTTTVSYFPKCKDEIKQYCSNKGTHVFHCLTEVIGRLGPKCGNDIQKQKATLLKENPCFFDSFEFCRPKDGKKGIDTYKCLRSVEHKISRECKEKMDKDRESRKKKNPCYPDIKKFCSEIEYGDAKVNDCLEKNQKKLAKKCVKQIENYKKQFPCYKDIRKHCKDSDKSDVNMCLIEKNKKLGKKCKKHMKGFHEKFPCYADIKNNCANKKGVHISLCLLQNEKHLAAQCKKSMEAKRKIRPCYDELILYCRDVPKGAGKARGCLKKNKKNLGKRCAQSIKKFENELPCLEDIGKHCKDQKDINTCLESKVTMLQKECRVKVQKGIANRQKFHKYCSDEISKFCKKAKGRGGVIVCLKKNKGKLSKKCVDGAGL